MQDPGFDLISAERLVLRRFQADDAGALARYRSEEGVARYQGWECPYPVAEARRFIASLGSLAPGTPGTWFQFAVSAAASGPLIGDCALRTSRSDPRQAELGFTFAPEQQGQGYASEAVGALLGYAFDTLGMHRVFAFTDVRNESAQRLLERVGFRCERELRECTWFKGAWASERLYARLASEHRRAP